MSDTEFDDDNALSNELDDFDNINFGGEDDTSGERTPLSKIKGGMVDEYAPTSKKVGVVTEIAKKALPKGYSTAFDATVTAKDTVSKIYDKSRKDLEPATSALKTLGRRAVPLGNKILPKGLAKKLEEVTAEKHSRNSTETDYNALEISNTLKSIFGAERIRDTQQAVISDAKEDQGQKEEAEKFEVNLGVTSSTAENTAKLVGYQDNVLRNYHLKSLELQYQHYFVARDSFVFDKASHADTLTQLEGMVKNTALPNEIKLRNSEAWAASSRELLVGKVQGSLADRLKGAPGRVIESLKGKSSELVEAVNDNLSAAADTLGDGGGDSGIDPLEIAGGLATGAAGGVAINKLAKLIAGKIEANEGVNKLGKTLQYNFDNVGRQINTTLKEDDGLLGFLGDAFGLINRDGETVEHNLAEKATVEVGFTNLAHRSIVEIIPGFQSRQLEQLTNIATGIKNDRIVYSTEREEFVSKTVAVDDVRKKFDKVIGYDVGVEAKTLVDAMEEESGVSLSDGAKLDFALQLVQDSEDHLKFNPLRYIEPTNIRSEEHQIAISEMMASYWETKVDADGTNKVRDDLRIKDNLVVRAEEFNALADKIGDRDPAINYYQQTANKELLREAGVIEKVDDSVTDTVSIDNKYKQVRDVFGKQIEEDRGEVTEEPGGPMGGGGGTPSPDSPPPPPPSPDPSTPPQSPVPPSTPTGPRNTTRPSVPDQINTAGTPANDPVMTDVLIKHAASNRALLQQVVTNTLDGSSGHITADSEVTNGLLREISENLQLGAVGFQATGRGLFGHAGSAAASGFKTVKKAVVGSAKTGSRAVGYVAPKLRDAASYVGGKGLSVGRGALEMAAGQGDIYVDNTDGLPVLTQARLRAGEYIDDVSGEVLKSFNDIRGAVRDSHGLVLTEDQYGDGTRLTSKTGDIKEILGRGLGRLKSAFTNRVVPLTNVRGLIQGGYNKAVKIVSRPRDVYLADDLTSPVLFRSGFKTGIYVSKASGRVLNNQTEIDGEVIEIDHNEDKTVILTREQLSRGLVYSDGTPVSFDSLLDRTISFAKKSFGKVKERLQGKIDKAKEIAASVGSSVWRGAKGALYGVSNGRFGSLTARSEGEGGINIGGGNFTKKIYHLLLKRWGGVEPDRSPDGSGNGVVIDARDRFKRATAPEPEVPAVETPGLEEVRSGFNPAEGVVRILNKVPGVSIPQAAFVGTTGVSMRDRAVETPAVIRGHVDKLVDKLRGEPLVGPQQPKDSLVDVARNRIDKLRGEPLVGPQQPSKTVVERVRDKLRDDTIIGPQQPKDNLIEVTKGVVTKSLTTVGDQIETSVGDLKDTLVNIINPDTEKTREESRVGSYLNRLKNRGSTEGDAEEKPGLVSRAKEKIGEKFNKAKERAVKTKNFLGKILPAAGVITAAVASAAVVATQGGETHDIAMGALAGGAVAAKAFGLLSNPVGWAVLGAGALYGGYKAYKYAARRTDPEPLEKLRFLQYGIPTNLSEAVVTMRYLEDNVADEISISKQGVPSFDFDNLLTLWHRFYADFNGLEDDPIHKRNFDNWFYDRFLPVIVKHLTVAQALDVDLLDVDDELDNTDKAYFVSNVQFSGNRKGKVNPYSVLDSPWPGLSLVDNSQAIEELSGSIVSSSLDGEEADLGTTISPEIRPKVMDQLPPVVKLPGLKNREKTTVETDTEEKKKLYTVKKYRGLNNATKINIGVIGESGEVKPVGPLRANPTSVSGERLLVPTEGKISSPFGTRTHPIKGGKSMHKGIDIKAPAGTPVYAAADGIVERAWRSASFGNVVYIRHPSGRITRYAHLSAFAPKLAALGGTTNGNLPILAGEYLGDVGSTGDSTGPHLHFEYRENDGVGNNASVLNPMTFFDSAVEKKAEEEQVASTEDLVVGDPIVPKKVPVMEPLGKLVEKELLTDKPVGLPENMFDNNKSTKQASDNAPPKKSIYVEPESRVLDPINLVDKPIAPVVNIEAPNLDGINKQNEELALKAEAQRNEQTVAIKDTNQLLSELVVAMSNQNNPVGVKEETAAVPKPTPSRQGIKPAVEFKKRT